MTGPFRRRTLAAAAGGNGPGVSLTRRWLVVVLALVLSGCADSAGRDTASTEDVAPTSPSEPERSTEAEPAAASAAAVDDGGAVGSAGPALLSPASPTAVVEIDRSPDARLAADARAVLNRALREHGGKEDVLAAGDSAVPAKDVYTAADLRAIERASRASRSATGRPAVYALVLEGRFEDDQVNGVAFGATAFAMFPDQIGAGIVGVARDVYESAVLVHELGHLFGLVNLTGRGAFHEDPEHPGHSRSDGSVMYWAVESISIANLFRGGPPREFDDADRQEMARIRAA